MDINNYSYTPHLLDEEEKIIASYENDYGYGKITIEQWGCSRKVLELVVYLFNYDGSLEVSEHFTHTKETYSKAREQATRLYNKYVPDPIPLF